MLSFKEEKNVTQEKKLDKILGARKKSGERFSL